MAITVKTASDFRDLTTVREVKLNIGLDLDASDQDDRIASLIHAASSAIETYCNRVFARQTYIETVAGTDHPRLMVSHTPVQSITSIVCDSSPVVDYDLEDANSGVLYRDAGWLRGAWIGWDVESRVVPLSEELNHTIEYEAGYLLPGQDDRDLPHDVEYACVLTVAHWYRKETRGGGDVQSKKVGDLAITYTTATTDTTTMIGSLPAEARSLLSVRVT